MAVALSLKQPWAALLVGGVKSVEVRVWPTDRRGRVLIHAARISDPRPDGWRHLPGHLRDLARQVGGVIGEAELTGCTDYRDAEAFAAETALHLNDAAWFRPPVLYGFLFSHAKVRPFVPLPGQVRFFEAGGEWPEL